MYQVVGKLNRLKIVLRQLNKDKFAEVEVKYEEAMLKLKKCQHEIQHDPYNMDLIMKEVTLSKDCKYWQQATKTFLWQKSKNNWLQYRDKNTKLFHGFMKARRSYNIIFSVIDSDGNEKTRPDGIAEVFIQFYTKLLGDASEKITHVNSALLRKGEILSKQQRTMLVGEVTDNE